MRGEVADVFWTGDHTLCLHDIGPQDRSCRCGARIAIVVAPLQLAFFPAERKMDRLKPHIDRRVNDGVLEE